MRKLLIFLFTLFLFTCSYSQLKKIAIVSIYFDKNLSGNMEERFIMELAESSTIDFDSLANDFKEMLFNKYVKGLPLELILEEEVINAEGYESLKSDKLLDGSIVPANGYVLIEARAIVKDNRSIKESFNVVKDADGVMVCYIDFGMGAGASVGPVGGNRIIAYANFKIFDKNGKKVVAIRENAESDGIMMSAFGGSVYDYDKLIELSIEALDNLYEDLDKKLEKNYKKVNKKLNGAL